MSGLVGNPEDRFSHDEAHLKVSHVLTFHRPVPHLRRNSECVQMILGEFLTLQNTAGLKQKQDYHDYGSSNYCINFNPRFRLGLPVYQCICRCVIL